MEGLAPPRVSPQHFECCMASDYITRPLKVKKQLKNLWVLKDSNFQCGYKVTCYIPLLLQVDTYPLNCRPWWDLIPTTSFKAGQAISSTRLMDTI